MEPNLVGRNREAFPISYAVYPRRLNNNGLKSLYIGICICIDSQAPGNNGGDMMCPSLTAIHKTKNHHSCWKLSANTQQ
ncbi:hypothetical protein ACTXT7_004646 [Hymenolepis weldensis]